jgi:hypothetical protein
MPAQPHFDRRFSSIDWHGSGQAYDAAAADFERFRDPTGAPVVAGSGGILSAGGLSLRPFTDRGVSGWLVRQQPYRWTQSVRVRP